MGSEFYNKTKFGIRALLVVTLLVGLLLTIGPELHLRYLISKIDDSDIVQTFGKLEIGSGASCRLLDQYNETAIPHLLRALEGPGRFAVAHVCLMDITNENVRWISTNDFRSQTFNGLCVEFDDAGGFTFSKSKSVDLVEHWSETLRR